MAMTKSEINKRWYEKHKEEKNQRQRDWRKNNPHKLLAQHQRYNKKLNLLNCKINTRSLSAWSFQVRERDTACLYCGSTNKLQAHHILSKSKHPEFALFLNNGICLCEICHIKEHKINGDI